MTTCNPNLPAFRPPPALPDFLGGATLTGLIHDGEALVLAREVGEALGYSQDGRHFVDAIGRRWAEMREGKHYRVLNTTDEQAGDVVVVGAESKVGDLPILSNRGSMCLTEKGAWRAIMLGRTEPCIKARDWVEDELMPWYQEQRRLYATGATPPPAPSASPARTLSHSEAREARLRRAQEVRTMKAARALGVATEEQERAMLRRHLAELSGQREPVALEDAPRFAVGIDYGTDALHQTLILRGKTLSTIAAPASRTPLPDADREPPAPLQEIADAWLSPMELAHHIGLVGTFDAQKTRIGRIITGAGFRKHPKLAHPCRVPRLVKGEYLVDENGKAKTSQGWLYRPSILPALEAWARKNQPKWLGLDEGGE
jgi:prophage antirepressor-like protein